MNVLVVGGAGYVGGALTDILMSSGEHNFTVYDAILYEEEFRKDVPFILGDVRDKVRLRKALRRIDAVVWLAAVVGDGACQVNEAVSFEINSDCVRWLSDNYDGRVIFTSTCHDTETRAVTKEGLKSYKEIRKGDLVLTCNLLTNAAEWKAVQEVIAYDYRGRMVSTEGRRTSLLVTPEHNFVRFLGRRSSKLVYESADSVSSYAATRLSPGCRGEYAGYGTEYCFPEGCLLDKMSLKDALYVFGLYLGDGFSGHSEKVIPNKSGLSKTERDEFARDPVTGRFVRTVRVGSRQSVVCNSYSTQFALPVGDPARDRLISILDKYGVKFWSNRIKIGVSSKGMCEFMKNEGGSGAGNKRVPEWVYSFDHGCIFSFFKGLMDSDGHKCPGTGYSYSTVSPYLVEGLIILGSMLGYSVTFSSTYSKSFIEGRLVEGTAFRVCLARSTITLFKENFSKHRYNGKVWCLQVEDNHNFFVVRNGRTTLSGNCSVFGVHDALLDEFSAVNPLSVYAKSKLEAERYLSTVNALIFRLGTLFGVGDEFSRIRFDLVVNTLTHRAFRDRKMIVNGGEQFRPILHVKDVAGAIYQNLDTSSCGVYILKDQNIRIIDLAHQVRMHFPDVEIVESDAKFEDSRNYRVDDSKARARLGFCPQFTVDDGIKEIKRLLEEGRLKNVDAHRYSNHAYIKDLWEVKKP